MDDLEIVLRSTLKLAARRGIDPAALAELLLTDDTPPAAPRRSDVTIAAYVQDVLQILAGHLSETRRTYKTGLMILARGIVLHWPYRAPGASVMSYKPWSDERVNTWLKAARGINDDHEFGLDLATTATDCRRDEHGAAVIWAGYGALRVAELTESQVRIAAVWVRLRALADAAVTNAERTRDETDRRSNKRAERQVTGDHAVRTLIAATRYLYARAAGDGIVDRDRNPAAGIKIAGGTSGYRDLLTDAQVEDARRVCSETGDDPELDSWIFFLHLLTGARQEGGWRLERRMLDRDEQLIFLPDKGSPVKRGKLDPEWANPAPLTLIDGLLAFAASRGSTDPHDHVLRTRKADPTTGQLRPVTRRRYNTIYARMRDHTSWADELDFGVHHLRHYAAAQMESIGGRAVKMRSLRHKPNGQTDRYGIADLEHVAWALAVWTGEPHPRSARPPWTVA